MYSNYFIKWAKNNMDYKSNLEKALLGKLDAVAKKY